MAEKKRREIRAFLCNNKVSHKHVAQLLEVLSVCSSHRLQWHWSSCPQAMYVEKHPQFCSPLQEEVQLQGHTCLNFPKDVTLISGSVLVVFFYVFSTALGCISVSCWRRNEVILGVTYLFSVHRAHKAGLKGNDGQGTVI